MNSDNQRRVFLKRVTTVAAAFVIAPNLSNLCAQSELSKGKAVNDSFSNDKLPVGQPRINEALQLYCYNDGSVELRTPRKSEVKISHLYNSVFEVDVLLLIACNKSIDANMREIATRHSLSESVSKNQANKLMNELYAKGLICSSKSTITWNTGTAYI